MKTGPRARPAVERFWKKVLKTETCWLWGGETFGNQYGNLNLGVGVGQVSAHRFSYELHVGPIPRGTVICHKCDVRNCVNPEHLYCGTHEDNVSDIVERGRAKNVVRKVGVRTIRTRNYKGRALRPDERKRLVEEYQSGKFTQVELAKRYRMSQGAVSATIRGWPDRKPDGGKRREGSFRRKLAETAYEEIRQKYATGLYTQTALADEYGIDQTYVSAIIKRKTRRDKHEPPSI